MNHNLSVGLLRSETRCVPTSLDLYMKCIGGDVSWFLINLFNRGRQPKYVLFDKFSSKQNFNGSLVDNTTLMGSLSAGLIDWIVYPLIPSYKRFEIIDLSMPIGSSKLCFFVAKKWMTSKTIFDKMGFFLTSVPTQLWSIFAVMAACYFALKLMAKSMPIINKMPRYRFVRKATFGFSVYVGILLYNTYLKVDFVPMKPVLPFETVEELIELVKSGKTQLVIERLDDFRYEMIDHSKKSSLNALKHALSSSKVILVPLKPDRWKTLRKIKGSFTVDTWRNFLVEKDQRMLRNIIEICPPQLPTIVRGSYGFPKKSNLVELFQRHVDSIYSVYLKTVREDEAKRKVFTTSSPNTIRPIDASKMVLIFSLYLILSICSIVGLFREVYCNSQTLKLWD